VKVGLPQGGDGEDWGEVLGGGKTRRPYENNNREKRGKIKGIRNIRKTRKRGKYRSSKIDSSCKTPHTEIKKKAGPQRGGTSDGLLMQGTLPEKVGGVFHHSRNIHNEKKEMDVSIMERTTGDGDWNLQAKLMLCRKHTEEVTGDWGDGNVRWGKKKGTLEACTLRP